MPGKAHADKVHTPSTGRLVEIEKLGKRAIELSENQIPELRKLAEEGSRSAASALKQAEDTNVALRKVNERIEALADRYGEHERTGREYTGDTPFDTRVITAVGQRMMDGFKYMKEMPGVQPGAGKTGWIDVAGKRASDYYEETDAKGGITAPTITHTEVARYMKERSLAELLCRVFPMTSDKIDVPTLPTDPSVYYVSQGNAPSAHSQQDLVGKQMTAATVLGVVTIQGELLEDTVVSWMDFWAEVMMDAFALKKNRAVFSETATDTNAAFTGAVQAVAAYSGGANALELTSGSTHFSLVTYDDLIRVQEQIPSETREGAAWVMNKAAWRYIRALRDDQGMPLIVSSWAGLPAPAVNPAPQIPRAGVLLEDPVYLTEAMPSDMATAGKAVVAYGQWKQGHALGDRMQFGIAVSDHAAFDTGASMVRARVRYAAQNLLPSGFATLAPAST